MPNLNASSFGLQNSSPKFVAQLNSALAYLQTNPAAASILQTAADNHVQILNNVGGVMSGPDNGTDLYSQQSNLAGWNPNSAMEVHDSDGNVTGVQSAALSLLHELIHSMDPNIVANVADLNPQYDNNSEYVAVSIEGVIARQLGEPVRDNHEGGAVITDNPTSHTMQTEDGGMIWIQQNASGETEYGPSYAFGEIGGDYVPQFGSTLVDGEDNTGHVNTDPSGQDGGDQGGGAGGGCVAIGSHLPDGRLAGDIKVGDSMELGDDETLVAATGVVSYSQVKQAPGYRIVTESGASLVCSDTAPIPSRSKGLLTPDKLLGEEVAVRWDENGGHSLSSWEKVIKVESVGAIKVQHITVGNKCFWAGEKKGAYVLHHNLKTFDGGGDDGGGSGGGDDGWDWWDADSAQVPHNASPLNAPQAEPGLADAQVVGVPHPITDGLGVV